MVDRISGSRQLERRRTALLLFDLACARVLGAPVGDGGREHRGVGRERLFDRFEHLPRGFDAHDRDAGRIGNVDRTADQNNVGARAAAAAAMAWPCLPDERLAMKRTGSIGSLVGPDVTSRRMPVSGPALRNIASTAAAISSGSAMRPTPASPGSASRRCLGRRCECRRMQVAPDCAWSLWPTHPRIHRRRNEDRLVGGKQHGGGEIVGVAACHFGQKIGRRRGNHDKVGIAREADMADIELALRIEQIAVSTFAANRADGQRRHEVLGRGVRMSADACRAPAGAGSNRATCRRQCAADDQKDAPRARCGSARLLPRRLLGRLESVEDVVAASAAACAE